MMSKLTVILGAFLFSFLCIQSQEYQKMINS